MKLKKRTKQKIKEKRNGNKDKQKWETPHKPQNCAEF